MDLADIIRDVLRTPIGAIANSPKFGFEGLERDGSTKTDLSEQVLADMARAALTHCVPGVVFNDITAHRDEAGQLLKVEVDFMDEIHEPASRTTVVEYLGGEAESGKPVSDQRDG